MPKRISLYVLLLVSLGVFFNHVSVTSKENGWLLLIDGKEVDALGMAQDRWLKLTRQCEGVTQVDAHAPAYSAVLKTVQANSPPSSESAQIVSLTTSGAWYLAELEFKDLLPAVVVIQQLDGQPKIVQNAIWSGETQPWQPSPFIRRYLSSQAPLAPKALLDCFDRESVKPSAR